MRNFFRKLFGVCTHEFEVTGRTDGCWQLPDGTIVTFYKLECHNCGKTHRMVINSNDAPSNAVLEKLANNNTLLGTELIFSN